MILKVIPCNLCGAPVPVARRFVSDGVSDVCDGMTALCFYCAYALRKKERNDVR